ncbi:MAG: hypothetical protein KAW01_03520 [Deltaproteobacteria bacterium]|nr:hypothetical protein [Deltaproteobacteria bacterium]
MDHLLLHPVAGFSVDLIIEGDFGVVPIEIKLNSTIKRQSLKGLKNFIKGRQCSFGIIVNRGQRIEFITDKIIQVPVHYL